MYLTLATFYGRFTDNKDIGKHYDHPNSYCYHFGTGGFDGGGDGVHTMEPGMSKMVLLMLLPGPASNGGGILIVNVNIKHKTFFQFKICVGFWYNL